MPLDFRGRALGVLAAFDRVDDATGFDADDEQLLLAFAASAATAVGDRADASSTTALRHALRAAEEERRRWARELHDETLQGLAALRVGLSAAAPRAGRRGAARRTCARRSSRSPARSRTCARSSPTCARRRSTSSASRPRSRRSPSASRAAEGLDVDARRSTLPPLDPEVETTVYRLVQEALTNVKKHAGATAVRVERARAATRPRRASSVADDGRGLRPGRGDRRASGWPGMRERAALAGGTLDVASGAGGTTVRGDAARADDAGV